MSSAHGSTPHELGPRHEATCTYCSCLCDDIGLRVESGKIVAADQACPLGERWFLSHFPEKSSETSEPICRIAGQPAGADAGIERAAELLKAARSPLIYGLSLASCEAQRLAVAIADRLGATIDTASSELPGPVGLSFHGVGEVTCTLGEIRNRGDLIIFWQSNPVETHPRHLERYSLLPEGLLVPRGRADRVCIVVDQQPTATSALADQFIRLVPERGFETLWTLRAIVHGLELDADRVLAETGTPLAAWQGLVKRMQAARFGVLLFGEGLARAAGRIPEHRCPVRPDARLERRHAFCLPAASLGPEHCRRRPGALLAERISLCREFRPRLSAPRTRSGCARQMLARGDADALLVIGDDPPARSPLPTIPTVIISFRANSTRRQHRSRHPHRAVFHQRLGHDSPPGRHRHPTASGADISVSGRCRGVGGAVGQVLSKK